MKRLRVGITVSSTIDDGIAALWASGVNQNAVFLALLLRSLPQVAWCGFVTDPEPRASPLGGPFEIPSVGLDEALAEADVLVELGIRPAKAKMAAFRGRGGRLVSYMAGNAMVMNFESLANKTPYGEVVDHAGYDAVWITPQHWHTNHAYARLTRSPVVEEAPHIWHPCVVELLKTHWQVPFEWRPSGEPWRIGVFEPNVNVVKTFHVPLLVCEEAFRTRPDQVARVLLFGTVQLKENVHFQEFCGALDLLKAGKIFAEGRHPLAQVLGTHVDAVVSHQWENALNYLYWDVLYGGFPLIHNSPELKDAGYYYPAFDPKRGGEVMVSALTGHAASIGAYRAAAAKAIDRFRIDRVENKVRYANLLDQLTG
jgi:hypothetical protein